MVVEALINSSQISASFHNLLSSPPLFNSTKQNSHFSLQIHPFQTITTATIPNSLKFPAKKTSIRCIGNPKQQILKTCKNCKTQFDPSLNHPQACRFHTAHFGGETKRKFESVYTGGTMNTPDSGVVFQYWHCCGAEDPFDPGCTAAPHSSYDD